MDTAGIWRYSKLYHDTQIENLSSCDAFCAIDSARVLVDVVDMIKPNMIHMDLNAAQCMIEEGRSLVIASNKTDLAGAVVYFEMQRIQNDLYLISLERGVPVAITSALADSGIK